MQISTGTEPAAAQEGEYAELQKCLAELAGCLKDTPEEHELIALQLVIENLGVEKPDRLMLCRGILGVGFD